MTTTLPSTAVTTSTSDMAICDDENIDNTASLNHIKPPQLRKKSFGGTSTIVDSKRTLNKVANISVRSSK